MTIDVPVSLQNNENQPLNHYSEYNSGKIFYSTKDLSSLLKQYDNFDLVYPIETNLSRFDIPLQYFKKLAITYNTPISLPNTKDQFMITKDGVVYYRNGVPETWNIYSKVLGIKMNVSIKGIHNNNHTGRNIDILVGGKLLSLTLDYVEAYHLIHDVMKGIPYNRSKYFTNKEYPLFTSNND